jgi:hypothetical protein
MRYGLALSLMVLLWPVPVSATPTFFDAPKTPSAEPNLFWPLVGLIGVLALSVAYTRR